ncbi:sensor histidine kinase [Bacillus sp. JJ722]|uniref:sensor histidine kinase n=1 Tax=Bacillus sp. JJ722 TaxID=3122973 RepID=UPI003000B7EB
MDIKWRNKKLVFIILLLFSFGCSIFFANLISSNEFLKKDYFGTNRFHSEYNTFLNYLSTYQLSEVDPAKLKKQITVSDEEIKQHRFEYGDLSVQVTNINEQYNPRISEAKKMGNNEVATILEKERDDKIKDITMNFTSDEHVRKKIIAQKEKQIDEAFQDYQINRRDLNPYNDVFQYYLEDEQTGKVYTSLNSEEAKSYRTIFTDKSMLYMKKYGMSNKSLVMENDTITTQLPITSDDWYNHIGYFNEEYLFANPDLDSEQMNESESSVRTFKGYIGIPKNTSTSEQIIKNTNNYNHVQLIFISCLIIGLIAMGSSLYIIKRRGIMPTIHLVNWAWYNRIPIDMRLVLLIITGLYTVMVYSWLNIYDYENAIDSLIPYVFISTCLLALGIVQIASSINSVIEKGYDEEIKRALVIKMYCFIKDAFLDRSIGMQILMLLVIVPGFGLATGFLLAIGSTSAPEVVLVFGTIVLIVGIPILYIIFKHAGYLNRIIQAVHAMANGVNEPDLEIKGKSTLASFANDVNLLKQGVKTSQREQVKSERLKTELITNVSHDLRTPLTSIITYTDLLKSTDVTDDERQSYIEIIDRKSKRLKVLIDDLFEASKMATGNIELYKSKVDLVQLLQQTLAEHDEEIASSQLQFRVSHDQQPIDAIVDGQKLNRVFDNLILNILKYSLPHSRVYIAVKNKENEVEISFKNVSHYELGCNVEELFERFKRGDQSRQTEGSGLGLAIAKSIIDLHDGVLDIDVDGDLFKVTIKLRKR